MMINVFEIFGRKVLNFLETVGLISLFFLQTIYWIFKKPFRAKLFKIQIVKVGIETLPVALITATFTGMIFIVQVYLALKTYTLESVASSALGLSVVRELAPILLALVMAGRVGASMTAELGSMKITDQIDALKTMGVEPVHYLVVPRFLATIIMMMCLVVITNFVGLLGGYWVGTQIFDLNPQQFIDQMKWALEPSDLYASIVKAGVFGAFISLIGCFKGFYAYGGSEGVGKSTTESVVLIMILILIGDYFLNLILW